MVRSPTGHRGRRRGGAEEGRSARGGDEGSAGDTERSPQLLGRIADARGRARGALRRRVVLHVKEGDSAVSNVVIRNARRVWAATGEVGWVKEIRGVRGPNEGGVYRQERQHAASGAGWAKVCSSVWVRHNVVV
jgi:hypothetical protein